MQTIHIGLDIGSTTVKIILLDEQKNIIYSQYARHFSQTRPWVIQILNEAIKYCRHEYALKEEKELKYTLTFSGSGAISLTEELKIDFVQEVIASTTAIQENHPNADVCIELGGEDAKIIFLTNGVEQRMNEACAGGTGAFIDQMAEFLHTDAQGLNTLAKNYKTVYPIASRCGVFAKTDILPLLNEGCAKEDISVSIFQAVVDQVIGGLACGREIKGNVLFLGGPLNFLPSLRQCFIDTLQLKDEQILFPENAQYYVALGAALYTANKYEYHKHNKHITKNVHHAVKEIHVYEHEQLDHIVDQLQNKKQSDIDGTLAPFFQFPYEREEFLASCVNKKQIKYKNFASLKSEKRVPLYLGIDAGSTTIKAVLFTEAREIVYSFYSSHKGEPLQFAIKLIQEIYAQMPKNCFIVASGATGYGSTLLKQALHLNLDEVETLAHFKAAQFFLPDVSYILDIGGQDIKCMSIKNGMIQSIKLNEACSAGCGSFIETFAKSLKISLEEFIDAAHRAEKPVDLGTRCTVFMNSKVKQAQKEGIALGDIAAGLSYSVVKNALYKVIRISSPEELGEHIMVQGGAFYNTALLRALELSLGKKVTNVSISGLMGAFGVALLAQEEYKKLRTEANEEGKALVREDILSAEEIQNFSTENSSTRCNLCTNHCILTITKLSNGKKIISGNRCEKGGDKAHTEASPHNMFAYKYKRLFAHYRPRDNRDIGTVGLPRALNMYENYPFWFTFFDTLGFRVELSKTSSKKLYSAGLNTIPSQAVCYPAKLAHGHIADLIQKKVDFIFYPCIPFENKEFKNQDNTYNCPVVGGYPELLINNITILREKKMPFYAPFLIFEREALFKTLSGLDFLENLPKEELYQALDKAFKEQEKFKTDIQEKGVKILESLKKNNKKAIVLAGHPYHVDPEINHGIPELINTMGLAVLTEDSISHLAKDAKDIEKLTFIDQWTYHARLYRAAHKVANSSLLAFVQLVSFGCGLDAITAEQSEEILNKTDTLYTQIKIDEGFNLGAARIRIRSLVALMEEQLKNEKELFKLKKMNKEERMNAQGAIEQEDQEVPRFTKKMRRTHTLLVPQMAPIHFPFFISSLRSSGYIAELLPDVPRAAIELGLKYVNNDACYPAITVIGQLIYAIETGQYHKDKVALLISQTGGGCRATNYVGFLRKALISAGLGHIPVVSMHVSGQEDDAGFVVDRNLFFKLIKSLYYGDVLMRLLYRTRPYEYKYGIAQALADKWSATINDTLTHGSPTFMQCYKHVSQMIKEFDELPLRNIPRKPRVGIVGEILLKFHPDANNHAIDTIEAEGGEVVMPDLLDFFLYCFFDKVFTYDNLNGSYKDAFLHNSILHILLALRYPIYRMLKKNKKFTAPIPFMELVKKVEGIVSLGHQAGEGWLLTAEMIELLEADVHNILCMQPFGCLPNHITGRGVIKELKRRYPEANITAVDYDASTSETNQINRIKLIMALAKK